MSSQSPYTQGAILDPEDLVNLEREGTVVNIPNSSAHRIHKRRLKTSSEEEYQNIQLPSPPSSVTTLHSPTSLAQAYQIIPEFLICKDTLGFLGFNLATADEIWSRWANWGSDRGREIDGGPVTFLSMATRWIRSSTSDAFTEHDEAWLTVMAAYGISDQLQTAIMTPFYKDIRLTASCKYWLIDTMSYVMIRLRRSKRRLGIVRGLPIVLHRAQADHSSRVALPAARVVAVAQYLRLSALCPVSHLCASQLQRFAPTLLATRSYTKVRLSPGYSPLSTPIAR